jgi:predicted Zn-dependent peptidase
VTALSARKKDNYLEASLADYRRELLPNGVTVAVKRQAGRKMAAARIVLAPDGREIAASEAGYDALALSAAALASLGSGASLELRLDDSDYVALEMLGPSERMPELLGLLAKALSSPSFAPEDFDRELRAARLAERRESGDPRRRAAAGLRAGPSPRGTAFSLAAATRDSVMRYWSQRFAPERLCVVVVGDLDPTEIETVLERGFGAIPGTGQARPERSPAGTSIPDSSAPDYPAGAVALAMLDDLISEAPRGTDDAAAAKAAVEGALDAMARGLCLDPTSASRALEPMARSLEAYKSRAITGIYAKSASSRSMAAHIARDLAAGGDGTALFRMAGRIGAVRAEDVARVAGKRLLGGAAAWLALNDLDPASSRLGRSVVLLER